MNLRDIGNTNLLELKRLEVNGNILFSKCELMNPSGSHKDRTFLHIVNTLERNEVIHPGMTLVDCSTGNGGAALAWIGKEKGYKVVIFMPEGMTEERKIQIKAYGASIVETPKEYFLNGSVTAAKEYVLNKKEMYFLDQSGTTLNKDAWNSCGLEIIESLKKIDKAPDYFICSIGTGGTFSGIAEVLKEAYPKIKTIGIEVNKSSPLYAQRNGIKFEHKNHNLMGLGAGILSVNTMSELIDEVRVVDGEEAWSRMKTFIENNGLGIGPTCGANLVISESVMNEVFNKVIITLFFDCSWKYKSRWNGVYPEYQGK